MLNCLLLNYSFSFQDRDYYQTTVAPLPPANWMVQFNRKNVIRKRFSHIT